jgi:hypothetical protein
MKKYWFLALSILLAGGFAYAQLRPMSLGSDSLVLIGTNGNTTSILPGTITTSFNLTLPGNTGTNGYLLQTDGTGILSWVAPASSGTPSGMVIAFAGATCPTGYVPANGASLSQSTRATLYAAIAAVNGDGSTNPTGVTADSGCPSASGCFNAPDYRGRFLRGVDGGVGRDPDNATRTAMATGGNTGDNIGSVQSDAFKSHGHNVLGSAGSTPTTLSNASAAGFGAITSGTQAYYTNSNSSPSAYIQSTGGNESRPVNAYVNYCLKL